MRQPQIDTTGLQPGSYQITASLSDGSQNGIASCSARFTVKMPHPPVISCSSDPASVPMGGTSTITSTASSPDGRLLSYNYTSECRKHYRQHFHRYAQHRGRRARNNYRDLQRER